MAFYLFLILMIAVAIWLFGMEGEHYPLWLCLAMAAVIGGIVFIKFYPVSTIKHLFG